MAYQIFTTQFFEKRYKKLSRKYLKIAEDLKVLISQLEIDPFQGVRLKGCVGLVFKIRMASRASRQGKSGAFRVIYLIQPKPQSVYLLTLYPKSESETIDVKEIDQVLKFLNFI